MFEISAIGAGHMGMAMLDGMVKSGQFEPSEILVYEINTERRRQAKQRGYAAAGSESEAYANAKILLLAVRPQECRALLEKLARSAERQEAKPTIISIMAGISSNYIRSHLGENTAVICAMPSMGMTTGHGTAAISKTSNVPREAFDKITAVFGATGEAHPVEEGTLKEIVAVCGCMPGYVFYLLDAFAKGAAGVGYDEAVRIAARGFIGAAMKVLDEGDVQGLLAEVCTPGGLTARGVEVFEQGGVGKVLGEGMAASVRRGYELGE